VANMQQVHAVTARRDGDRANVHASWVLAVLVLATAVLVTAAGPARATTYKWTDEKGVVHYSDKMPPEAVDKASVQLNKEGIPIKRTEKVPTPEERRAVEQEEERQRQAAKQREEIARRDRALVASYTSEAEIDLARNRALQTINSAIQSSLSFSEQLNKRKTELAAKKTESQGKPMTTALDRELESIDAELARQADLITQKKREVSAITAKYDADKNRWRELVASKAAFEPAKSASAATSSGATATPGASAPKK